MPRLPIAVRLRTAAVALTIVAVAGCTPARQPYSAATTPPPADPVVQRAQAECANVAARETENVTPQGQASRAALGIYYKCMAEKGFPQHDGGSAAGVPH